MLEGFLFQQLKFIYSIFYMHICWTSGWWRHWPCLPMPSVGLKLIFSPDQRCRVIESKPSSSEAQHWVSWTDCLATLSANHWQRPPALLDPRADIERVMQVMAEVKSMPAPAPLGTFSTLPSTPRCTGGAAVSRNARIRRARALNLTHNRPSPLKTFQIVMYFNRK